MGKNKQNDFLERRKRFLQKEYGTPVKQILSYLWEYKKTFTVILIFGILQSILFLTFPLFLGPAMDVLVNPIIPIGNIFPIILSAILVMGIVGILFGIRNYINQRIGARVIYNLRNDLFSTIQLMSWSWFDKNKTGELISRTTSDANLLKDFLGNSFQHFIGECATLSFSFLMLFIINSELALFVLIISPALLYTLLLFRKKLRPAFKKSRKTYADLTHAIQENVQGITVVKSFGRERHEIKKFTKKNDSYFKETMGIIKLRAIFDPIIYLINNLAFLIVILFGGSLVIGNSMSFGDLFAFVMVLNLSVGPLYYISYFLGTMPQISESCKRVTHILNSEIMVEEKQNAIDMPSIQGEIEFKNVYFTFDQDSDYYILKNINFKVKPGENIAILGPTGSGKSTLIK